MDCLAANNTVYLPTTRVIRILQETVSRRDLHVLAGEQRQRRQQRVLLHASRGRQRRPRDQHIGADTSAGTFAYTNNLWFASDDSAASEPSSAYGGATVTGTLSPEDPAFANAANGNFAIDAESPPPQKGSISKAFPPTSAALVTAHRER